MSSDYMEERGMVNTWRFHDDVLVLASERKTSHRYGRGMTLQHAKIQPRWNYLDCEVWVKMGQSNPSHSSNPRASCFPQQIHRIVASLHCSSLWGPVAHRTAMRWKRRRFSSTGLSGIWPHRASFSASEIRKQARQEKHREAQQR